MKFRVGGAALVALALLACLPAPGRADLHIQGFGLATTGKATATPGLSDEPQRHEMRLDFDAVGAAYAALVISTNMSWDCRHDPETEEDDSGAMRQGFTLTSLEADETRDRGVGTAVGRCTGWAPEYPFPFELTCPVLTLAYARSDLVMELAGTCLYNWGPGLGGGDFTMTIRLANPSEDGTTFDIATAFFRFRA